MPADSWNGIRILTECTEGDDEDSWEAWLEDDAGGFLGEGSTEIGAIADLIDQLNADAVDAFAMAEMAADDQAHAAMERRAGL